jgi:hypothetical protein
MEYAIARRTPRYYFAVDIEVTDLRSGTCLKARTTTLGRFGCGIDVPRPFARGTDVTIKISHRGADVNVDARVVYATPESGMGMVFIGLDRDDERILDSWIEHMMSTSA